MGQPPTARCQPAVLLCTVRGCHLPLARERRGAQRAPAPTHERAGARCAPLPQALTHRFVCPRGHSFDIARSGYINLLQPQERRSRTPGDREEAVTARRRFLDRGHAEPLLRAIAEMLPTRTNVLDVGCGEGYYLGSLGRGCGIDISTAAIDLAARRYPECQWVVANADRFIPYADASFDLVLSITGRLNPNEFRRVSRGHLLVAVAAPDDLIELRGGRQRDRVPRTIEMFASGFSFIAQQRASTVVDLDATDAWDILTATYRPRDAAPQRVTLSLDLLLFSAVAPEEKRGTR